MRPIHSSAALWPPPSSLCSNVMRSVLLKFQSNDFIQWYSFLCCVAWSKRTSSVLSRGGGQWEVQQKVYDGSQAQSLNYITGSYKLMCIYWIKGNKKNFFTYLLFKINVSWVKLEMRLIKYCTKAQTALVILVVFNWLGRGLLFKARSELALPICLI